VEISLVPLELARWDQGGSDHLFIVPIWSDVRPLRGAAGLLDWRLNGRLSDCLRAQRFSGSCGEKLLVPTRRLGWKTVLAVGQGAARTFDEGQFRAALETALAAAKAMGRAALAVALPGRDLDRISPARAVALLRELLDLHGYPTALTLVDTPAALKTMGDALGLPAPAHLRASAPFG
jgi:leucyl aminopeptidase